MANFSLASFTSASNTTSGGSNAADVSLEVSDVITLILNAITCPFTVLLNVLVIMAVKRRSRLQTNSNILLTHLAIIDASTGLLGQPTFILWQIFLLLGVSSSVAIKNLHFDVMSTLLVASCFHLMMVTFERLIAMKFTMYYLIIVTDSTINLAVLLVWIMSLIIGFFRIIKNLQIFFFLSSIVISSCIFSVTFSYMILYHETSRHKKKMKAQQLRLEEIETFTRENKALKTTVFVVGAVFICFLPVCFCFMLLTPGIYDVCIINEALMQTFAMINSFVNPLIYCWRQKEMRKFVFRIRTHAVHSVSE